MEWYSIERMPFEALLNDTSKGKVLVLLGPRRVGKTVLIRHICEQHSRHLLLNGEDITTSELLAERSVRNYSQLIGDSTLFAIDEAQHIDHIGMVLKLMVDSFPDVKFLVTGSSQFDLGNKIGEPLTGRKKTYYLFPLAQCELQQYESPAETRNHLHERLIYGSYPEVFQYDTPGDKAAYLHEVVNSYLLKDILAFEGIKNATKIFNLLRMIAYRVGSEVSNEALGNRLGVSKNTVERYLSLLQKVFVLYNVSGYSRNLSKEIIKTSRWYFIDNGIRNAVISNFSPLSDRDDTGSLWENYVIMERLKWQNYSRIQSNNFFWRTYDQQEIDWIEERDGRLYGFEMKWRTVARRPLAFAKAYPQARFDTINQFNYLDFIGAGAKDDIYW